MKRSIFIIKVHIVINIDYIYIYTLTVLISPNQLITRLPTLIAQLNVGNNSIDLINEIRQTLYVLHRNNVITKHVYNRLIEYCTSLIKDITL